MNTEDPDYSLIKFKAKYAIGKAIAECTSTMQEHKFEGLSKIQQMVDSGSLTLMQTVLKYEQGIRCGAPPHFDVNSMLGTAIICVIDTTRGRFHDDDFYSLPEQLNPGDVIVMDPNIRHWVEFYERSHSRRMVIRNM